MLISILIPCFNARSFVAEAIESALAQTWPNKEIIVLDDGSTDGSLDVVKNFGDRIRWKTGPNRGGNMARNQLLELAQGEWLQYLDADDYLLPGKLGSQITATSEADVVYGPVFLHDVYSPTADRISEIPSSDEAVNFIRWGAFQTTGMLFRREAVVAVGGWKDDQPCCQEHELLLRLLMAGSRFALADDAKSIYRFHGDASVSRRDPTLVIRTRMELTDRFAGYLEAKGRLTAAHRKALFIARMESARSMFRWNPRLAEEYCVRAFAMGQWWPRSVGALRWHYQMALRLLGFRGAESLAARLRAR